MSFLRRFGGFLRDDTRTFAVAACMTAIAGTVAAGGAPAVSTTVASGPARSLGEPAAARDSAVSAVVATSFGPSGAQVRAWTRPASSGSWTAAGLVLPAGFGSSYDASAAASPGGPLLVVAGTSPAGESCITNGSVAIANVYPTGRLGPARLVSDQRGTGRFDDRPVVTIGTGGTVWVAWSEGPDSDACENVGTGDRLEVAASHDGGRTFGAPVTMPAEGGGSAFGARLAPLGGGRVAVSWTERMSGGDEAVLVSVLQAGGQVTQPQPVLRGDALPLVLPGASFYDFPAGDVTALPGGKLVVAAPFWRSGRSVIDLAVGTPGGRWQASAVNPPAGADLLLPALGPLTSASARLLCAVHDRAGDRLGYDWADLRIDGRGYGIVSAGLASLTPSPSGPGFFELGEELSMTQTPSGLLSAVVVAGSGGAALETRSWAVPRPAATLPPSARPSPSRPDATRHGVSDAARPGSPWAWPVTWTAAAIIICAGLFAAWAASARGCERGGGVAAAWRRRPRRPRRPGG